MMTDALATADRALCADIWTSRAAWEDLLHLCEDYGSRFAGTAQEKGAADFLAARLCAYGLADVRLEPFTFNGWQRGPARLQVLSPDVREVPCLALPYCPGGAVEGEIVNLGNGTPGEFEAAGDLGGKIALIAARSPAYVGRGVHRGEKYGRAVAAGASGVLWMRAEGGLLPETGSLRFNAPAEILGLGISNEDGAALLRLAEKGPVRVRLSSESANLRSRSQNVSGVIPGRGGDREILVGAHYDAHDIAPGAVDDGTGAVVTLEVARALCEQRTALQAPVRVVFFGAEEMGLVGAHAYVAEHRGDLDRILFMLNVDAIGQDAYNKGLALQGWASLIPYFRDLARMMGEALTVDNDVIMYSDHFPFMLAGVPSGYLCRMEAGSGTRGYGHTAADTLDKVKLRDLRLAALLTARLALYASHHPELPARRKPEAETIKLLHTLGYDEVMRIEQTWPFQDVES
jgi:Zn-dependent M28 family amino/carboxypeptidase